MLNLLCACVACPFLKRSHLAHAVHMDFGSVRFTGASKLRGPCLGVRLGVVVFWAPGVFFEATIDRSIQDAPL